MEGDLQRIVGQTLRAHREARGLSQEAFANLIGVHRTYMGGVERGERNLTLRSLERIASKAGVDPLALLQPLDAPEDQQSGPSSSDLAGPPEGSGAYRR